MTIAPGLFPFLSLPAELRITIYEYALCSQGYTYLDPGSRAVDDELPQTAMLRLNRESSVEAVGVFYRGVRLIIQLGDIVCLKDNKVCERTTPPCERVWRHQCADYGARTRLAQGTPPAWTDRMLPHVFSRFEKITFDLKLDLEDGRSPSLFTSRLRLDSNLNVDAGDCAKLSRDFQRTSVLPCFAKLLAVCPRITQLVIHLDISVEPEFDVGLSDDACEAEVLESSIPYFRAADVRATEIFIESGLLNVLKNVPGIERAVLDVVNPYADVEGSLDISLESRTLLRLLEADIVDQSLKVNPLPTLFINERTPLVPWTSREIYL